jgi:hypothetical protein
VIVAISRSGPPKAGDHVRPQTVPASYYPLRYPFITTRGKQRLRNGICTRFVVVFCPKEEDKVDPLKFKEKEISDLEETLSQGGLQNLVSRSISIVATLEITLGANENSQQESDLSPLGQAA